MVSTSSFDTTHVLLACADGDRQAFGEVVSHLYEELRAVARRQLHRAGNEGTLDTTALVHETYLKLAGQPRIKCRDRGHFLAMVAVAMRHIIVDSARRRTALKRGGAKTDLPLLSEAEMAVNDNSEMLIALDDALENLAALDQRLIRIVECRCFAGFTEEETAEALGVSRSTVQRDWARARAWLRAEIEIPNDESKTD